MQGKLPAEADGLEQRQPAVFAPAVVEELGLAIRLTGPDHVGQRIDDLTELELHGHYQLQQTQQGWRLHEGICEWCPRRLLSARQATGGTSLIYRPIRTVHCWQHGPHLR